MAVDSSHKRYSMMSFISGDALVFESDAPVAVNDRLHLLNLYSGIPAEEAPVVVVTTTSNYGAALSARPTNYGKVPEKTRYGKVKL